MFDFFKKAGGPEEKPTDVKMIREHLLQFIKDQLRRAEGGEGGNIKGLQLFVACPPEEKAVYEAAVYYEEKDRFRNEEVQRIADDYAIALPEQWTMETTFADELPAEAAKVPNLDAALLVLTRKRTVHKSATAYIKVRNGEAEKEVYTITSSSGKVCIGRERRVQTKDGFFRENNIAFPATSENSSNRFVSRQHAHIEWDEDSGSFLLYADEGGVPPGNKIKVRSVNQPNPVKLFTTHIGHPLQEGDQILLGESALLEFSYSEKDREL